MVATERGDPREFDRALGVDPGEVLAFIEATQRMSGAYSSRDKAALRLHARTSSSASQRELDERGAIDVFRHGVNDLGVEIRLAYFKPAHGLTPQLVARYKANRLLLVRQLAFSADETKTIDLALVVNGIPVATAELKNPLTGQTIEHAMAQYRTDRNPHDLIFAKRTVVHFAVDPHRVAMTTGWPGGHQLPAVQPGGSAPAGAGTAGTRPRRPVTRPRTCGSRCGSATRGSTCSHVRARRGREADDREAGTGLVFPRFHQWHAVRAIEARHRATGPASELPRPALRRLGEVEHDRVARAPAVDGCTTPTTSRSSTRSSSSPTAGCWTGSCRDGVRARARRRARSSEIDEDSSS